MTYEYLEFQKRVKAYANVCRLNNTSMSGGTFLANLLAFSKSEFSKAQAQAANNSVSPKIIFLKSSALVEVLASALRANLRFRWEISELT